MHSGAQEYQHQAVTVGNEKNQDWINGVDLETQMWDWQGVELIDKTRTQRLRISYGGHWAVERTPAGSVCPALTLLLPGFPLRIVPPLTLCAMSTA